MCTALEQDNIPRSNEGNENLPDLRDAESVLSDDEEATDESIYKKDDHKFLQNLTDYLEILVFSVIAIILLFTFIGRIARVSGESMNQTLNANDVLVTESFLYTPKIGDVVIVSMTSDYEILNEPLVKRVIAIGGDTVDIDYNTGTVFINGEALTVQDKFSDGTDSYVYLDSGVMKRPVFSSTVTFPYEVPEGFVFVMGDNRNNSLDSRSVRIGAVDTRRIIGKVVFRITPDTGPIDDYKEQDPHREKS